MNEENWLKTIAIIVVLLFVGGVAYLVICKPDISSGAYTAPDTRSTTQKECEAAKGVYTTGFFSEGCTFPPKNIK